MNWLLRLFRREQMEEQLDKELQFHIDQHAGDLMARGLDPDEARRRARLALGGPEQVKEKCRDARGTLWLEDLAQDVRYAVRSFRQKPGFAAVAIAILALGIGSTTVMFAVVDTVLLRPLRYPDPGRLVSLRGHNAQLGDFWGFSGPDLDDLKRESKSLTIAAYTYGGGTISEPRPPEYVDGLQISAGLFETLGVSLLHGRAFRPADDQPGAEPVAIISHSLWQRRFAGDLSIVGGRLVYDGRPYTVIGVAPSGDPLLGEADVFTPLGQSVDPRRTNRRARFMSAIARIRPASSLAEAQSELAAMGVHLAAEHPKSNEGIGMKLVPLQQELTGDAGGMLWLLFGAVGMVLLVACVNVASLFLTRAISRERQLAMRVALGAGRSRLIRQCLTESMVLSTCGGLLGILLATMALRPFITFWPGSLPHASDIQLDWRVLLFAIGASLASGFLFGLAPALRVRLHGLRGAGRSVAGGSRRWHSAFIICEIALAFGLLVCAGILANTMLRLSSLAPGVRVSNVLTARFAISPTLLDDPTQIRAAWRDVLERARQVPGVESAALADIVPMREGENSLPYRTTAAPARGIADTLALATCVTPEFRKVMGLQLLAGRFLDEQDRDGSEPVVVIDENLARHAFGNTDAIGKRLWIPALGNGPVQIAGVVGHVRHWGLANDDQARVRDQLYYPFAQVRAPMLRFFSSILSITVLTKDQPLKIVEPLRMALSGASQDQALYEVRTIEQLVSASLDRQRFLLFLFGVFASVALLLASIGIYGVLAYLTGQRTSEIGVRIALGATAGNVVGLVLRQCLGMVLGGLGAGILVALAAARLMQRLVVGVEPHQATTFAAIIPLLLTAALLAGLVPAVRACRVDPVQALRRD